MVRVLASAALAAVLLSGPAAADIVGPARVIDGDTIEIDEQRIRLWGIDAPETDQTCDLGQGPFGIGEWASMALDEFIAGRPVTCQQVDTDRYRRVVARCHVDGHGLGSAMVLQGLAWDYTRYSGGAYAAEQALAQEAERGVWGGDCDPPWEHR